MVRVTIKNEFEAGQTVQEDSCRERSIDFCAPVELLQIQGGKDLVQVTVGGCIFSASNYELTPGQSVVITCPAIIDPKLETVYVNSDGTFQVTRSGK